MREQQRSALLAVALRSGRERLPDRGLRLATSGGKAVLLGLKAGGVARSHRSDLGGAAAL